MGSHVFKVNNNAARMRSLDGPIERLRLRGKKKN